MFSFSLNGKEISHKINGLRSLSIGQLLSLKSDAFSILKRESRDVVAYKFKGDNLLCSNKNCCFLVIFYNKLIRLKNQVFYQKNRLLVADASIALATERRFFIGLRGTNGVSLARGRATSEGTCLAKLITLKY